MVEDLDQTDGRDAIRSRRMSWGVILVLAILFSLAFVQRATLLDRMPWPITAFSVIFGLVLGAWSGDTLSRSPRLKDDWRRLLLIFGIPIAAIVAATFLARSIISFSAFAAFEPQQSTILGKVDDIRHSRGGTLHASLNFGPQFRDTEIKVTDGLYDTLEPHRFPGRDCILLRMETGRWGYRRVRMPNLVTDEPVGRGNYIRCAENLMKLRDQDSK